MRPARSGKDVRDEGAFVTAKDLVIIIEATTVLPPLSTNAGCITGSDGFAFSCRARKKALDSSSKCGPCVIFVGPSVILTGNAESVEWTAAPQLSEQLVIILLFLLSFSPRAYSIN